MGRELPHVLKSDLDLEAAIKQIQENFDALAGRQEGQRNELNDVFSTLAQVEEGVDAAPEINYEDFATEVGAIRIVDTEADLVDLEAKDGDSAYVRGLTGLYKYMDTAPFVTTYVAGVPTQTEVSPVTGTTNWFRSIDAADFLADSITATHIAVDTLDAISANLGTVNAGVLNGVEINGGTITGGLIRTSTDDTRIEMSDDLIKFWNSSHIGSSSTIEAVASLGVDMPISHAGSVVKFDGGGVLFDTNVVIANGGHLKAFGIIVGNTHDHSQNFLRLRSVADNDTISTPPSGYVSVFYNSATGRVNAKNSAGTVRQLNETTF